MLFMFPPCKQGSADDALPRDRVGKEPNRCIALSVASRILFFRSSTWEGQRACDCGGAGILSCDFPEEDAAPRLPERFKTEANKDSWRL
jgi:hypothetical protein